MDTYCEQLVRIKKGAKFYLGVIGLWFAVLLIAFFSMLYLRVLAAVIIVAAGYGAYYLMGFLLVEYEYIITNGELDIDIIYSKRSRKRLATFELSEVESIEKYNGEYVDKNKYKKAVIACDVKADNAYRFVFNGESGLKIAIITPDARTREEVVKFVPRFVGNSAFK